MRIFSAITLLLVLLVTVPIDVGNEPAGIGENREQQGQVRPIRYKVVDPGTHPGLLFSKEELPVLMRRAQGEGLAAESYRIVKTLASGNATGSARGRKLMAMALIYQIERDNNMGRQAVELMKEIIAEIDPFAYHEEIQEDFFATDVWPIPFAYAWDWLYEIMDENERMVVLKGIENWCKAMYEHTEAWWWQDASINCGAIPVGALGLACTAIRGETRHPEFEKWLTSAIYRIQNNYFPNVWRENGINCEGPCYAQYHKNPSQFGEALRRTGGPDILAGSGAINGMQYQLYQWMPQEGCTPIGDNTNYGRRVFESAYLLGIGDNADGPGLWTFEKYTDRKRLNPIIAFLWYPDELESVSPGIAKLQTSRYFEITPNRAGYIFSRSEWDNERSAFFAFVTRYENANHEHYDMNSFLFSAFGEEFATHKNIYGYTHEHHGVDFEHNMVIIDGGGMPAFNRTNSCGEQASILGLLTAHGLGHFADYVRGDASGSYKDPTDPGTTPALRADRYCLFVKQGTTPYLFIADNIQKSEQDHSYFWQWYTPAERVKGSGSLSDPILIEGVNASCSIGFLEPERLAVDFQVVKGGSERNPIDSGLIRVHQRGSNVRYISLAATWENNKPKPMFKQGSEVVGNPSAVSLIVEGNLYSDLIVWQPEEHYGSQGAEITCGGISTNSLVAMVRLDSSGHVIGYMLGEGSNLRYNGQLLAEAEEPISVSADDERVYVTGRRRAKENLPPLPARGRVWLPGRNAEVFADGKHIEPRMVEENIVQVGGSASITE